MEKMDQQMEQNMVIDYKYIYIYINYDGQCPTEVGIRITTQGKQISFITTVSGIVIWIDLEAHEMVWNV